MAKYYWQTWIVPNSPPAGARGERAGAQPLARAGDAAMSGQRKGVVGSSGLVGILRLFVRGEHSDLGILGQRDHFIHIGKALGLTWEGTPASPGDGK